MTSGFFRRRADLAVWLLTAFAASVLLQLPALDRLDRLDLDVLHLLRSTLPARTYETPSPVAVVAIDEASHQAPGLKGIPRVLWTPEIAAVQDAVLSAGAIALGWDIILPNASARFIGDNRYDAPLLRSMLRWGRREGKIVLGEAYFGDELVSPHRGYLIAAGGAGTVRQLALSVEPDGVVRDLPGFIDIRGDDGSLSRVPALAGELAARYLGGTLEQPPRDAVLNMPADPAAIPLFSFADIVACAEAGNTDYLERHFRDRVVLLGVVLDVEDRRLAPNRFSAPADFAGAPEQCGGDVSRTERTARATVPGVMIHAAAVDNLVRQSWMTPPGLGPRLATVLMASLIAGMLAMTIAPRASVAATIAIGLAWSAIAAVAFRAQLWLPLIDVWVALLVGWSAMFVYRTQTVERARATMRRSFSRYLDEKLINEIVETGKVPELGGERRRMTVLFSDIVAFSTLSEVVDPPEIVRFLNIYFRLVGDEIKRNGGIIERFIGDSVVAVFGAPIDDTDHARNGVLCALGMVETVRRNAERFGVPPGFEVAVRIGVNSGDMTVGNVGAENRFTYTVMGDSVNLAARLETAGKQLGTDILVGSATRALTADLVEYREVDRLRVVGRDEPETVYEPLGPKGEVPGDLLARRDAYHDALDAIRRRDFATARSTLERLSEEGDRVSARTLERLALLEADPPGPDWDGVTSLTRK